MTARYLRKPRLMHTMKEAEAEGKKKPISHITRPALCTAGDVSQSIAVAASMYRHRRGKPHMIPG